MRPAGESLRGQVVLITGAGAGIGAAGARELVRRGAFAVLLDVDGALATATAEAIGPAASAVAGDVCSPADCQRAVDVALRRHGRLDAVWANAGIASFGPLAHTDPVAWRRCFEVNVFGVFNSFRAALPAVLERRGSLLVSASAASFAHPPMMSAYAASKAAVEAMANAWRIELAAHGVGVGVVHASWVRTPLVEEGELHPGFQRLRDTAPRWLRAQMPAEQAARLIIDGLERRADRIWVPGWVRMLHWLRPLLHLRGAEAGLRRAAPDLEAIYLEGLREHGALASSLGPREHARAVGGEGDPAGR
jgi:NAD(P)-dependent dehydrogenase (short-subunit alcohol dehydrogenase family)